MGGGAGFQMSPIGLDTDMDVAGFMEQDWMWDLDGMFWGQQPVLPQQMQPSSGR